jgi:aromatic ring-opening dioxygenase catalytic subunit (LigB family)
MGEISFAAAMSHAPGITAFPERAPRAQRDRFYSAMAEARRRFEMADPEIIVVATSDHFTNLFINNMPAFCVGLGETYKGPAEKWVRLEETDVRGARAFAKDLLETAFDSNLELSFSERLALEYSIMIPLHFLMPDMRLPIVPIIQNCQVPPLPRLRRCYELGQVIRQVVNRRAERVAVIGTGGLSHAPGAPEAGRIDEAFDRDFLAILEKGDTEAAVSLPTERIDAAGFGTWEVRQWVMVLGAVPDRKAQVLAYEAVKEWETGCAVVTFE